jgi:hypothetical protein
MPEPSDVEEGRGKAETACREGVAALSFVRELAEWTEVPQTRR